MFDSFPHILSKVNSSDVFLGCLVVLGLPFNFPSVHSLCL